ncbi:class I SAM-dependent methyltransferase [Candidatus Saccharibacteria bacterium]|nr:class I SAM-dependent methyltransferase [Candidatus Saccharibacteria bacterium]
MKNEEGWQPSKILLRDGKWYSNESFVGLRSEHVGKLECKDYVDVLERHASGDLLDIGAGTVPYYGVYKDKTDSVVCVDWAKSLHDLRHIDVIADVNLGLPFEENKFDTVLLADVLEHIKDPGLLISECSRVLRRSGKIIIFVPFMYWIHEQPNDYYRYTEYSLAALAKDNNLDVVELHQYGGGPDILIDATQKMFSESRVAYKLTHLIWKQFIKTTTYEKLRAEHIKRFPIGYSFVAQKR